MRPVEEWQPLAKIAFKSLTVPEEDMNHALMSSRQRPGFCLSPIPVMLSDYGRTMSASPVSPRYRWVPLSFAHQPISPQGLFLGSCLSLNLGNHESLSS